MQEVKEVPTISESSRIMAEEARKKLLGDKKGNDIVSMLYEKDKVRTQEKMLRN